MLLIVLVAQVVGAAIAFGASLLLGETMPAPIELGWSVVGGIGAGIGIVLLYHALAHGRMGVVAPVTGVISASMPVLFGIVTEGLPGALVLAGIGLAIVAVVLVSRIDDGGDRPSGVGTALVAGVALGAFGIAISQLGDGHTFGPLTVVRATEALLIVAIVVLGRRPWRADRRLLPAMAGVGVLDMTGNATFILAVQSGSLAIAAVLSSLYPVTTVILATVILRERITRSHAVGIMLAAAGIVCITVGSL